MCCQLPQLGDGPQTGCREDMVAPVFFQAEPTCPKSVTLKMTESLVTHAGHSWQLCPEPNLLMGEDKHWMDNLGSNVAGGARNGKR